MSEFVHTRQIGFDALLAEADAESCSRLPRSTEGQAHLSPHRPGDGPLRLRDRLRGRSALARCFLT